MLPKFLIRANEKVLCNVDELNLYIPAEYFDETFGLAISLGNKVSTMGIFYVNYKEESKNEYSNYFLISFPNTITIEYSSSSTITTKMPSDEEEEQYKVFTLKKGDVFLENENAVKGFDGVEKFIKLLFAGKVPKTSYENIFKQLISLQEENNINLKTPFSTVELMIAELTRYKKDKMIPFRIALAKGAKESDYDGVPIKMLPNYTSAFAGVSFENIDQSLLFAIDNERNGKPERITSTEETIYL